MKPRSSSQPTDCDSRRTASSIVIRQGCSVARDEHVTIAGAAPTR
jgi:hypothetical protein